MIGGERTFGSRLLRWYDRHRRELPWRVSRGGRDERLDPYRVLVSETMLQQTQVATVVPYFLRFIERFPTFSALAEAPQQDVLRLWQGLGYYSRARNLYAAAQRIVREHDGQLPRNVQELQALPGVGRYTAGAVASIAFDCRAPILDGNVMRVLCRIDHVTADPREKWTREELWRRAEEILPQRRCGDFNSALMELGATVCTPRNPKCLVCPVRQHCAARAAGVQEQIPPPRKREVTPLLRRKIVCVRRGEKYLIEQRPARGRWAGMWQFVTLDGAMAISPASLRKELSLDVNHVRPLGAVKHALTHRRYHFDVYVCDFARDGATREPRRWTSLAELNDYPLPRPHVRVMQMLTSSQVPPADKAAPARAVAPLSDRPAARPARSSAAARGRRDRSGRIALASPV